MHCGHVVVVDAQGAVLASAGVPDTVIYPRSALKPFQAAASLDLIEHAALPTDELAIMAASHTGTRTHQGVVLRLLSRADVAPAALRCPLALPIDRGALRERPAPSRLAHNCSGKHAGFLLATRHAGGDPRSYLAEDAPVQRAVLRWVRGACGTVPEGPGVDGCGAPAWRLPLLALAHGYARLAGAPGSLGEVATAMRTHPELVGGEGRVETMIMAADSDVTAKGGAEATLGIAVRAPVGPIGVAIKVSDGATRALGPVAAAVLACLGIRVPATLARPDVLGGGRPHGALEVTDALQAALAGLTGLTG
jgi:L-asparaginase II